MDVTVTEATISGVMSFANYSIQVAAVNSAGTGDYTNPVIVETNQCECVTPRLHVHAQIGVCLFVSLSTIKISLTIYGFSYIFPRGQCHICFTFICLRNVHAPLYFPISHMFPYYQVAEIILIIYNNSGVCLSLAHIILSCLSLYSFFTLQIFPTVSSQTDNIAAVVGGVVAVMFMIITAVTVTLIVILVMIYHRGKSSNRTQERYNNIHKF